MNAITSTLPNFPQLNQNSTPPLDGYPDPNAGWECVPTSISDGLRFKLNRNYGTDGTPFDGDGLRDKVYGENYRGGQAASQYVAYCASQGVLLSPVNGSPAALVGQIHSSISQGNPVIATIPSMWGLGRDGARQYAIDHNQAYTTHVVCFCGQGNGSLRASNPWIAPQWHDGDDQYWINDLEDNQIWVMSLANGAIAQETPIMLQISQASTYFDQIDDTHWKCHNGFTVGMGILQAYRNVPALGTLAGLTAFGLPVENEVFTGSNGVAMQKFERALLVYDPKRSYDSPPGAQGDVYVGHMPVQTVAAPAAPAIDTKALKSLAASAATADAALQSAVNALP